MLKKSILIDALNIIRYKHGCVNLNLVFESVPIYLKKFCVWPIRCANQTIIRI